MACKEHDIANSNYSDSTTRAKADARLITEGAWERFKSNDALLGEKSAVWGLKNIMKAKNKLGGGVKKSSKSPKELLYVDLKEANVYILDLISNG